MSVNESEIINNDSEEGSEVSDTDSQKSNDAAIRATDEWTEIMKKNHELQRELNIAIAIRMKLERELELQSAKFAQEKKQLQVQNAVQAQQLEQALALLEATGRELKEVREAQAQEKREAAARAEALKLMQVKKGAEILIQEALPVQLVQEEEKADCKEAKANSLSK